MSLRYQLDPAPPPPLEPPPKLLPELPPLELLPELYDEPELLELLVDFLGIRTVFSLRAWQQAHSFVIRREPEE